MLIFKDGKVPELWRICEVELDDVLKIRHEVMWPDKDLDYVRIKGEEQARHYGYYRNKKLVSVVTLLIDGETAQFRKFATLLEYQNKGYGTLLLERVLLLAKIDGVKVISCNARVEKIEFYKKFGLNETKERFIKSNQEYVVMSKKMD